jgi:hypothetical protein
LKSQSFAETSTTTGWFLLVSASSSEGNQKCKVSFAVVFAHFVSDIS